MADPMGDTLGFETVRLEPVRIGFWKKWETWLFGFAMVFVITVAIFAGVIGAHAYTSSKTNYVPNNQFPPAVSTPSQKKSHQ